MFEKTRSFLRSKWSRTSKFPPTQEQYDHARSLREIARTKIASEEDSKNRDALSDTLLEIERWHIRGSFPSVGAIDDLMSIVSAQKLRPSLIDTLNVELERSSLLFESPGVPGRVRRLSLGSVRFATWSGLLASYVLGIILILLAWLLNKWINVTALMPLQVVIALLLSGFLGSSVSIIIKTEGLDDRSAIDPAQIFFSTIARPLIGSLFALLLYCILATEFIRIADWSVPKSDSGTLGFYLWLVGFIAGFSERLVPDLIGRAERTLSAERKEGKSATRR